MADGSLAISSAVEKAYPMAKRLMCWAHLLRNFKLRVNALNETTRNGILGDLQLLQYSRTEEEFDNAISFLSIRWPDDLYRYFVETWISSGLKHFYEGASPFPSSNNGLEAHNKQIKSVHTRYKRRELSQFLPKAMDIVDHWSKTIDVNNHSNLIIIIILVSTKAGEVFREDM